MHLSRIFLISSCLAGVGATFMPWARMGMLSVDGTQGDGWITLGLFVSAMLTAFVGDYTAAIKAPSRVVLFLLGVCAAGVAAFDIMSFSARMDSLRDNPFASAVSLGPGIYLVVLAGVGVMFFPHLGVKGPPRGAENRRE